ncbi:MAG TPA: FAD-dependent oxidoreductase [Capillimicrobium sp.]|nr:FAD-dependent oxidoreductase [Capillimicrobium sp.]
MPGSSVDVAIVGGGHNGLVAAALLARAGRSVVVLERRDEVGGAAVSERPFPGVDARLSRYAYLVSLFPRALARALGLDLELRRRRVASYTPGGDGGILNPDTGAFGAMGRRIARAVFPTVLEPLRSRAEMRALVGDDAAWEALVERPVGEAIEAAFDDDVLRGIVATDALIGTFASMREPDLRQNRCLLYHVIGNGTGDWDVPVGGMGAVTAALAATARDAGADLRTGVEVTAIAPDGEVRFDGGALQAGHVLCGAAPATLARLLGEEPAEPAPEGAQLKVNMVLSRLPRLRDAAVDPRDAFAGTLHVNESYAQLQAAYDEAAAGRIPSLPPCEIYCHSLTDPTILGPDLRAAGAQTLTLFGLHMPARLFAADHDAAKRDAVAATLRSLNAVLAEPIEDCLWTDADGAPCLEARTPQELEAELGLPGGHIFHRDLRWPFADDEATVGTWGVETHHERVLLCGAGAVRGGGVSGIPGHNAARAVLAAAG